MRFLHQLLRGEPCFVPLLLLLLIALSYPAAAKRTHRPTSLDAVSPLQHGLPDGPFAGFSPAVQQQQQLHGRGVEVQDLECRRVHEVKSGDKCAFIRENCQDERVGLLDYLELYYCRLNNARALAFMILALWLGLLFTTIGIAASDFFCINLSTIASLLGMSESMAGVTFLAFGNGSPDVFSTFAAMKVDSGSLAVGELIGAASFIAAVVAGSMAIVRPFKVGRRSFIRDVSFFMVAVVFGIFFLADGKIQMWECTVMVLLYVFYVCFVVVWHWVGQSKKRRRQKERQAREHHIDPSDQSLLLEDEEEDEDEGIGESSSLLDNDIGALERANGDEDEEDEDEERREQEAYAELSSNMRVARPGMERRHTPTTPHAIRPSLVGALEFRSVLNSLRKSQNLGRPIRLRSYSEDGFGFDVSNRHSAPGTIARGSPAGSIMERQAAADHQHTHVTYTPSTLLRTSQAGTRGRAVSLNDASHATVDVENFRPQRSLEAPTVPLLETDDEFTTTTTPPVRSDRDPSPNRDSAAAAAARGPLTLRIPLGNDLLAPPPSHTPRQSPSVSPLSKAVPHLIVTDSDAESGVSQLYDSPRPLTTRTASPTGSLRLPSPSVESSSATITASLGAQGWAPIKHWPYHVLPPPQLLFETLFPTLRGFRDKSIPEKALALIFAPSVFLLTITLPVVDRASSDPVPAAAPGKSPPHQQNLLTPESPLSTHTAASFPPPPPAAAVVAESAAPPAAQGKDWNRWLAATQCITAPLFIVLTLFADNSARTLTRAVLWGLLIGCVALGVLVSTTSPHQPPRYHYLLCFVGFAVSISWISTVAEEVVGVLKAFGVIFGISDAILGLTIFAVGNSLGDLVADITVARLGFPVMALSACFGGPMLNILLGVGISGLYITAARREDEYRIEVSSTLVISAATLLATLAVLLVWVPLNRWMMSRRIGWTIVAMWAVSTVANVVVEVSGIGAKWSGASAAHAARP